MKVNRKPTAGNYFPFTSERIRRKFGFCPLFYYFSGDFFFRSSHEERETRQREDRNYRIRKGIQLDFYTDKIIFFFLRIRAKSSRCIKKRGERNRDAEGKRERKNKHQSYSSSETLIICLNIPIK